MIKTLYIENYLFIEKTILEFSTELNIIIGESGVGKSMIVNILSIPLGYKPGSKVVGKWGKKSIIKIVFEVSNLKEYFALIGLDKNVDNDNCNLELTIEIDKKTQFTLNGISVSSKKVKIVIEQILDIHSQNNYNIFQEDQLGILYRFMNKSEEVIFNSYQKKYGEYLQLNARLEEIEKNIISEVDMDFYKFQVDEIKRINPQINEDKTLFDELKQIRSKIKLLSRIKELRQQLDDVYVSADKAMHSLTSLQDEDSAIKELKTRFEINLNDIEDILWEFSKKEQQYSELEENSGDLVEDRINILEDLKRKYKKDIGEIVEYQANIELRLSNQDQYKADLEKIKIQQTAIKQDLYQIADQLSEQRKKVAKRVIDLMTLKLLDLKLGKTELAASFIKKNDIDENGWDEFNFLIKINVGSNFYQFDKLSGGETSRVMLALKSALMTAARIKVYVFDEIDAGVSGDIAIKIGNVLKMMSKEKQLIIITHLPTIAVKADKLFKINKVFINDSTIIDVEIVNEEKNKLEKLASLLTETPSEETIAYVKSLQ